VRRQSAINNKLAPKPAPKPTPKPNPNPTLTLTLTLTKLTVPTKEVNRSPYYKSLECRRHFDCIDAH